MTEKKAETKARLDASKPTHFSMQEGTPEKTGFKIKASNNFFDEYK